MNLTGMGSVQPKFGQLSNNQRAQLNSQFTRQIPTVMEARVVLESLEAIGDQFAMREEQPERMPDSEEFRESVETQLISLVDRLAQSPLANIALAGLTRALGNAPFPVSDNVKNAFKSASERVNAEPTGLLMDDLMSGVRPPVTAAPADLETFQKAKAIMQGFRSVLVNMEDGASQNPESIQAAEAQLKNYIEQATEMSTGNVMLAFFTNALEDCSHPVSDELFESLKAATDKTKALAAGSLLML